MPLSSLRIFVLLFGLLPWGAECAPAPDKVRLQLKWQHQFQFAGYYAAREKGYYREAGLEVEIIPSRPGDDSHQKVLNGEAEFGVGTTDLLLLREQGAPVVVLAVIFQHSPLGLAALASSGIQDLHDLAGRQLMIEPGSAELFAYLRREGMTNDRFILLPHGHSPRDLIEGKVDALSVYTTDEPFELVESKQDFVLYSPRSGGIDFYGDNLFTTEAQIRQHPERVKAFRAASLKGWKYAMEHPEEIARLIHDRYSDRHSLPHLEYEARQMAGLLHADIVETGHMYAGRWQHIAAVYAELGMLRPKFDLTGFLYDAHPPPPDLTWLFATLGGLTLVLLVIGGNALYIFRINRRLRISEKRWQHLFDVMPMAMLVSDHEERLTAWNEAATHVFGWSAGEALGKNCYELLVPMDQQDHVHRVLGQTLNESLDTESLNRNCTKSGAIITCEWRNTIYHDDDGRVAGAISLGCDVSGRILAQQQLKEAKELAERRLDDHRQFLGMVAHEFRSPLAAIDATTQVLELQCAEKCHSPELIWRIQRGVGRLSGFIDNCLTKDRLIRIEEEGMKCADDRIELPAFLASIVEQTAQSYSQHDILLAGAEDAGIQTGDAHLLRIMLHNLLGNACKYSPPGSRVWLRAEREPRGELLLTVEDEGAGIAPEDLDKITRRYYRGTSSKPVAGAGLGLFLVDRILALHGGSLRIDSKVGAGTAVRLRLPPTPAKD